MRGDNRLVFSFYHRIGGDMDQPMDCPLKKKAADSAASLLTAQFSGHEAARSNRTNHVRPAELRVDNEDLQMGLSHAILSLKFHFLSEAGRPSEESASNSIGSCTFFARPTGLAQKVEF